jgi:hypothetical protein
MRIMLVSTRAECGGQRRGIRAALPQGTRRDRPHRGDGAEAHRIRNRRGDCGVVAGQARMASSAHNRPARCDMGRVDKRSRGSGCAHRARRVEGEQVTKFERIRAMVSDQGDTWDLSTNDKEALQAIIDVAQVARNLLPFMQPTSHEEQQLQTAMDTLIREHG